MNEGELSIAEPVEIRCPNCAGFFEVALPIEPQTRVIGRVYYLEETVACPACDWEMTVDSHAGITDDGEVATDWELEVNDEGELTDACGGLQQNLHELLEREDAGKGWVYDGDELVTETGASSASCPCCRHAFKDAWLGPVHCPACDFEYRIECEASECEDDYDDSEPEILSTAPETIRTLTVSSDGSSRFTRIGEAIQRADPGDRIRVLPGLYEEEISIFTQLQIVGDGSVDDIILVGRNGPCVTIDCAAAVVRGLTLRGLAGMRGRPSHTVDLISGSVEDCVITSDSLACVKIQDSGTLRRCLIHDGEETGIIGGTGLIVDCEIVRQAGAGIELQKGGDLIIRDSLIARCAREGIAFGQESTGIVANCTISDNGAAGIVLRGDRTLLWKCRIRGNDAGGIIAHRDVVSAVEECEIAGNLGDGVSIASAHLQLFECRIERQLASGVVVSGAGVTKIENCTIIDNGKHGIAIARGADPHIVYCNINGNAKHALSIRNASTAVEDCDLTANGAGAIELKRPGEVSSQRNRE